MINQQNGLNQTGFDIQHRPLSHSTVHSQLSRLVNVNPMGHPVGRLMKGSVPFYNLDNQMERLRPITTQNERHLELVNIANKQALMNSYKTQKINSQHMYQLPQSAQIMRPKFSAATTMSQSRRGPRKPPDMTMIESFVFPAIYFAKTLPPEDERTNLIYQIVSKLFHEIKFYIFHLLVTQHELTNSFFVFFSDAETTPFSKCCNAPVYIEFAETGYGKILCNADQCRNKLLTEFIINLEDSEVLWQDKLVFREGIERQKKQYMRNQLSRLVVSGKYRNKNLTKQIKKATTPGSLELEADQNQMRATVHIPRQFDDRFMMMGKQNDIKEEAEEEQGFITNPNFIQNDYDNANSFYDNSDVGFHKRLFNQKEQFTSPMEENDKVDDIQITFKRNSEFQTFKNQMVQGLVMESKVFNKDFDDSFPVFKKPTGTQSPVNNQYTNKNSFHHQRRDKVMQNRLQEEENTLMDIKNLINQLLP